MPIYEYSCNGCRKVANIFVRSFSSPVHAVCPSCHSEDMSKLISRPNVLKSDQQRLQDFDIGRRLGNLENPSDPGAVARWAKEMGKELGDEMGAELREMAEQVTEEDRPPELDDPGYFSQSPMETKRQELLGQSYSDDAF